MEHFFILEAIWLAVPLLSAIIVYYLWKNM
jgi:hypothetical protein